MRTRYTYPPRPGPNGKMIIDELCYCGAKRSQHENSNYARGHGPCPETQCRKFTWAEWVFADSGADPG